MDNPQAELWVAVQTRNPAYNGVFVYATKTTGIYCRPSCPSRHPKPAHVCFFDTPEQAEQAGFRACKRCHPAVEGRVEPQAALMVSICRVLEEATERIPTLDELAAQFNLSASHLQRTFKRIIGVSPRQYADAHRQGRLKESLKRHDTVTDALYEAGYNASSQLYENAHATLGMTPLTYREGGKYMEIWYSIVPCRLGFLLVAATDKGICKVCLEDSAEALRTTLQGEFPEATLIEADETLGAWVQVILDYLDGEQTVLDLPLDIRATSFQRKVWETLRMIPYGETRTYQEIAQLIQQPTANRAVAQACAHNPVALIIPCHRVVRHDGSLSGYRWGVERKRALLDQEAQIAAQTESALPSGD